MSSDLYKCADCGDSFPASAFPAHGKKCKGKGKGTALAKPAAKKAAQAKLPLTGGTNPPDWSRARTILAGIRTAIRLSLAGQVLLGQELLTIKTELGFGRGGDRRSNPNLLGLMRTWEQWVKAELGISDQTAANFIGCYEAAKQRVKRLGGNPKLIGLLESHPAQLTEEDGKLLSGMVDKLVDGDSQKALLEELKIAKCHVALTGGATPPAKKPANAEQLLFAMFAPVEETIEKAAKAAERLRLGPDYQHLLYALPLVSSEPGKPSLAALEAQLEAALNGDIRKALDEIRAVKEARMKDPAAKPAKPRAVA